VRNEVTSPSLGGHGVVTPVYLGRHKDVLPVPGAREAPEGWSIRNHQPVVDVIRGNAIPVNKFEDAPGFEELGHGVAKPHESERGTE
jgi:hypothetical protein